MPSKQKPNAPNKIKLDPVFVIPPGAEELFVYSRDITDGNDVDDPTVDTLDPGEFIDALDAGPGPTDSNLGTPDSFVIISQTLRRAPGGQHVIDVVVGIQEVPGALDYEIEVVKI